jgi:predicted transcriptional regulator
MDHEFSGQVDLFGCPIMIRETKKGRPTHVRSAENANKISILFALGGSVADAARALGITQPTLRKHYFSEVEQRDAMAVRLEASLVAKLFDMAKSGNVGAIKQLLHRHDRAQLARQAASLPGERRAAAEAIGKKEARAVAASKVEGMYAPRTAPASLIN